MRKEHLDVGTDAVSVCKHPLHGHGTGQLQLVWGRPGSPA